jgi:hypothetical protein
LGVGEPVGTSFEAMNYAVLFPFCIVMFELFVLLKIGRDAMAIITRSQQSMRVLMSSELGDDDKEVAMRRASVDIFKATLRFALKFFSIGLILYLLFVLIVTLFPNLKRTLLESLYSPIVIAVLTFATMGYAWVRKTILSRLGSSDRA